MKYIKWLIIACICIPVQCFASMTLSQTGPALSAEKSFGEPAAMPQFVEKQAVQPQAPSVQEMQKSSLDTLDIDASGNWLEKRYWHQKAEKTYELIKAAVAQIVDMRTQFYNGVHGVGQELDNFYETVNFDKGQIDRILQDALQETDVLKQERGDLSASERDMKRGIQDDQKQLELLGKIIKNIHDIDTSIEQVFAQALQTIDNARKYETQAWDSFKKIAYELDDKKAEAEYYKIDGYYQNTQQVLSYLQNQLLTYLQQTLIQKIHAQMQQVQQMLADLKKKDLDIVALINKQRVQDVDVEKAREQQAVKIGIEDAEEKMKQQEEAAQKAPVAQSEWYDSLIFSLQLTWNFIVNAAHEGAQFLQQKMTVVYEWLLSWIRKE